MLDRELIIQVLGLTVVVAPSLLLLLLGGASLASARNSSSEILLSLFVSTRASNSLVRPLTNCSRVSSAA